MTKLPILVFGAGGHGKVIADVARSMGLEVLGFVDRDKTKLGRPIYGVDGRVLYTDSTLPPEFFRTGVLDGRQVAAALGIGENATRSRYAERLQACALPVLAHARATVSPDVSIGDGCAMMANCLINPGAVLGRGVIVNSGAVVEHDCVIGDWSHIAPSATLAGNVHIGRQVFVGAQAVIIQGISIGDNATIGAGAVVLQDVPAGATVVGNPASIRKPSL